jgi:hypothetical protein
MVAHPANEAEAPRIVNDARREAEAAIRLAAPAYPRLPHMLYKKPRRAFRAGFCLARRPG